MGRRRLTPLIDDDGKPIYSGKGKPAGIRNDRSNELCFHCVNGAGGCEWSNRLQPVPGWTAEYTEKTGNYWITACPKYEEGDRLWSSRRAKQANANESLTT